MLFAEDLTFLSLLNSPHSLFPTAFPHTITSRFGKLCGCGDGVRDAVVVGSLLTYHGSEAVQLSTRQSLSRPTERSRGSLLCQIVGRRAEPPLGVPWSWRLLGPQYTAGRILIRQIHEIVRSMVWAGQGPCMALLLRLSPSLQEPPFRIHTPCPWEIPQFVLPHPTEFIKSGEQLGPEAGPFLRGVNKRRRSSCDEGAPANPRFRRAPHTR